VLDRLLASGKHPQPVPPRPGPWARAAGSL